MRALPPIFATLLVLATTHAQSQERQWNFDQTDSEAYLVFGVPETDDVGVSFWCELQSGAIKFYVPQTDPKLKLTEVAPLDVDVGSKLYRFIGRSSISETDGKASIEVEIKTTDPIFADFQEANKFSVKAGSKSHIFPLNEVDFTGLLSVCRKP